MLNGYEKTFSLFGGQMEEILVIIYFLSCYLLYQQRTEGIDSFILKWTRSGLARLIRLLTVATSTPIWELTPQSQGLLPCKPPEVTPHHNVFSGNTGKYSLLKARQQYYCTFYNVFPGPVCAKICFAYFKKLIA